ncbi:MAG: 30S ribosomal protein S5 [Candidatus Aenigmatarchaeota archaeon]
MTEWTPRTELGKMVANNLITIDEIFAQGKKIKEPQIVDKLLPNLRSEIIFIGGSPGKGGGIKRTPTRRTARMHRSGRRYKISAMVVVGNGDGYIGIGKSYANEHNIAINKATENAKLNIIPIKRGCGSWECGCGGNHSIPFKIEGRSGSVRVMLIPAPRGIGLCINDEAKKVMKLAGITDIWSRCFGESRTRVNYIYAIFDALKKMNKTKLEDKEKKIETKKNENEYEINVDEVEEEIKKEEDEIKKEIKSLKKKAKKIKNEEKELINSDKYVSSN